MVSYYTQLQKCSSVKNVKTFCLFFLKLYVFVCIFYSHCLLKDTNLLESISGLATSFSQIIFHSPLICQDILKRSCSVPVSPFPGCLLCLNELLSTFHEVVLNSWKLCDSLTSRHLSPSLNTASTSSLSSCHSLPSLFLTLFQSFILFN